MDIEKERNRLREIQQIFESAVKNNEIEKIEPYTHPDFSFVSFTDRCFMDFDSFQKRWKQTRIEMVGSGSFETDLDPKPSFFYNDIAVTHGNSKNIMVDKNNNKSEFTSNWTVVFKKEEDQWKVIRAHNSIDPFANPMLIRNVNT